MHPRVILVRAVYLILAIVVALYGLSVFKKIQRRGEVVTQLRAIASESSYFHQFYAEDARKALVRAVGLLAEAKALGLEPSATLDRALGLEKGMLDEKDPKESADPKVLLVFDSLHANFVNLEKLGYGTDLQTVRALKSGELPPLPAGPHAGRRAEILPVIDPALSPGLEKVLANLSIRPPGRGDAPRSDVETAAAKQLAGRLAAAGVIEHDVSERIAEALTAPDNEEPPTPPGP